MDCTSRRKDLKLRSAIELLRASVSKNPSDHTLYSEALKSICSLCNAPYGCIVKADRFRHGDTHQWSMVSFYDNATVTTMNDEAVLASSAGNALLPMVIRGSLGLFDRIYSSRAADTASAEDLASLSGAFSNALNWPRLHQCIVMPILDANQVYSLICLFNRQETYTASLVKRIWPFLTTIAALYRLIHSEELNICFSKDKNQVLPEGGDQTRVIYGLLENQVPVALVELDQNLKVTRFNPASEKLFGMTSISALGLEISELIPERFPNEHRVFTFSLLPGYAPTAEPKCYLGRSASGASLDLKVQSIVYTRDHQPHRLLMITDCSEMKLIKQEQEAEGQRFRAIANLAPVGILQVNENWEATYINHRWFEICQREEDEVNALDWVFVFHFEDVEEVLVELRNALMQGQEFTQQCRLLTPIGETVWVEFFARPLYDASGEMSGFVSAIIDYTYRHHAEQRLRMLAEKDTLTGLANRALFQDRLSQALARTKRQGSLALLSLDLDGFKNVNDNLGHDVGDKLLVAVAERLTANIRETDTVARVGGDEFLILAEDIQHADYAAKLSDKILKQLADPFFIKQQEVFISGSIGITFAVGSQDQLNAQSLLKQVDLALYQAKNEGRNNYQYYSPELDIASSERLYLGNSLHRALDRREFMLHYQLQCDLNSGEVIGTEVLLRWKHPKRGMLQPKDFINILEESGLIVPVTRWIIQEAFQQQSDWIKSGLLSENSHVAINVSPRVLRDSAIVEQISEALTRSGLKGQHVVLEITESALLETTPLTQTVLNGLRALGLNIALDDFGTGYSSLTYLKRFPISCIKIDQSFVRDLLTDPEDAAITEGIIRLAQSLGLTVVAEGVDAFEKLEPLRRWGCQCYQGYALNRPSPPEDISAHIQKCLA